MWWKFKFSFISILVQWLLQIFHKTQELCHIAQIGQKGLTHKQSEKHGCIITTIATDILVLKHQALSFNSDDLLNYPRFIKKYCIYKKLKLHFEKIEPVVQGIMKMVSNQIFNSAKHRLSIVCIIKQLASIFKYLILCRAFDVINWYVTTNPINIQLK